MTSLLESPWLRGFGKLLIVAVAYALFARLGLLLAVGPTGVSVVWPAAGLALAAVLLRGRVALPGTALGYLISNGGALMAAGAEPERLLITVPVALGAALQAWVGAVLIQRSVGFPNPLYRSGDIWRFSLLSGPVACVVSAAISTLTYTLEGTLDESQIWRHLLTWWAGDAIGVLVFAPACIFLFDRRTYLKTRRRWTVVAPVVFILTLLTLLTLRQQHADESRSFEALDAELSTLRLFLSRDITIAYSLVDALQAYHSASVDITADEFQHYVESVARRHDWLFGGRWIRRLNHESRADWEQAHGHLVRQWETHDPAPEMPWYYVVEHRADVVGERDVLGIDLGGNSRRLAWLAEIERRDTIHAMVPVRLQRSSGDTPLVLILLGAVYADEVHSRPRGFVALLLEIESLIQGVLQDAAADGLVIAVDDITQADQPLPLYSAGQLDQAVPGYLRETTLLVGERSWRITLQPTWTYLTTLHGRGSWLMLIASLAFVWLLMLMLLMVTGQEALVRGEVVEKTGQLQVALNAVQSASEAKSRFLAAMSHELRTPLNSIIGFSRRLLERDGGLPDPRQREAAQTIRRNGQHLLAVINDILDVSKIEAGEVVLDRSDIDVRDVVKELRQALLPLLESKPNVKLESLVHSGVDILNADRRRLIQILFNLLSNAIKFTDKGEVILQVTSLKRRGRQGLRFAVRDSGIGIRADDLARLFSPFSQLEAGRAKAEGTGLGLVLVKDLAELHGGQVGVTSEAGVGSEFWVWLPLRADDTD